MSVYTFVVQELEMENSRLMELLSTCRCQKVDKNHSTVVLHWILPGGGYCVVHDSKIFSVYTYMFKISLDIYKLHWQLMLIGVDFVINLILFPVGCVFYVCPIFEVEPKLIRFLLF